MDFLKVVAYVLGVWLVLSVLAGLIMGRAAGRLNRHVPPPDTAPENESDGP